MVESFTFIQAMKQTCLLDCLQRKITGMEDFATMFRDPGLIILDAYSTYYLDSKGNSIPVQLSIEADLFNFHIEKLDLSLSQSPLIEPPALEKTCSHASSSSGGVKRALGKILSQNEPSSKRSSTFSNFSYSSYRSVSQSLEQIPVCEIHSIRITDFSFKICPINGKSLKKITNWTSGKGGSWKNNMSKCKMLEIIYGKEFNLKCLQFLVKRKHWQDQFKHNEFDNLEEWVNLLESAIKRYNGMEYFEKMRYWYQRQFSEFNWSQNNDQLLVWKYILLHKNSLIAESNVDFPQLQQLFLQWKRGSRGFNAFDESEVICNYFVESSQTISKIIDSYTLPETDSCRNIPTVLETMFQNYFAYVETHGKDLPLIPITMDGATMATKNFIRKVARNFYKESVDHLLNEKWLCSYYILDYMFSFENTIWSAETTQVYQDMTRPLSHYWIASSHNTYLTGDQCFSESSVKAYARVLREGCRCIEIDVWDGPSHKPIVKHGHTLTTSVKLKDVLEAIKANAFVASEYPLIISIENHCSLRQQKTMAKYFKRIFGRMLVTKPVSNSDVEPERSMELPSPEQLKNRIIIKGRKLPRGDAILEQCDCTDSSADTNSCDCLITDELLISNEKDRWKPYLFVLTKKKLFYLEKIENSANEFKIVENSLDIDQDFFRKKSQGSSESSNSRSYEKQDWFFPNIKRSQAENILEKLPTGSFLARYKTGSNVEIVITFRYENILKHCQIKRENGYFLVSKQKFDTLENLISYYYAEPFYKNTRLKYYVGRNPLARAKIPVAYGSWGYLNSTVKTTNGSVRAIESFNTTEPGLLSFKKGEIIVNVLREPDGWWWGTKDSVRGDEAHTLQQFPESYVEELEEIDKCAFEGYSCKGTWNLGTNVKVKACTDTIGKEYGIKYYLRFKYLNNEPKKQLGVTGSKRGAQEWADLINYVISNDKEKRTKQEKTMESEKYQIDNDFSDLICYCCAMSGPLVPESFENCKDRINACSLKSLDELSADRLFRSNVPFFAWYHQYALTRVYPKAQRFNSSNYSPVRFWNFSSQMVALNYQTPDKAMQWNRGKFRQNGSCGYVLKPEFMMALERQDGVSGTEHFDPTRLGEDAWKQGTCLTIQLISARHLEKPGVARVTPLIEIQVIGVDLDCRKIKPKSNRLSRQKSNSKQDWNAEPIQIKLRCPELALIQFSVYDIDISRDKQLIGEATIPFPCIRTGYRSIQLNNAHGFPLFSALLVYIALDEEHKEKSS